MTLREAYDVWAQENVRLAAKYRQANKKVLLDQYGDLPVTQFDERFVKKIFAEDKNTPEDRARAGSTLQSIISIMCKAKMIKPIPGFATDTFRLNMENSEDKEAINGVMMDVIENRQILREEEEQKQKEEKIRRPGLPGNAHPILKLDPKTLEVIKEYDCMSDACKDNGLKSLGTYIKGHYKGNGFYWCYPERLEEYREEIRKIQAKAAKKPSAGQPKKKPEPPKLISEEEVRERMNKILEKGMEKEFRHIPIELYNRLQELGIIPNDVRSRNVGASDYSQYLIQPWSIWLEYGLNPWDADIIKRVLRYKSTDTRVMDYEKIIHICEERIRQLTGK